MKTQCIVCQEHFVARRGGSPQKYCSVCKTKAKGCMSTLQRWATSPEKYNCYITKEQDTSCAIALVCLVCGCTFERKRQSGQAPHYCYECGKTKGTYKLCRLRNTKKKNFTARVRRRSKCVVCGYNGCIYALEFHHRDETIKKFNLSRLTGRSLSSIKDEIRKCDVLCSRCHRERHWLNFKRKHRASLGRKFAERVSLKFGCCKCGYKKCAAALDFHHIDPKCKKFAIGDKLDWLGPRELKREMRKCSILCANCHREQDCRVLACFQHREIKSK